MSVNVGVQYGLTRVAANRAIALYLFELVVTAVSVGLLGVETLTLNEWCGGALIIVVGVLSGRIGVKLPRSPDAVTGECVRTQTRRVQVTGRA